MYLVGTFEREYYDFGDYEPMEYMEFKAEIERSDLVKSSQDENFQVINILKKEYYDPKSNKWVKIKGA